MSAFKIKVKTDNAGTSNSDQFTLPLRSGYTYNFNISGSFTGSVLTVTSSTSPTLTFPGGAGTYELEITENVSGGFPTIYFNNGGDKLKLLETMQWGTNKWTTFERSFYGCSNHTIIATDEDDADTGLVTNFTYAWRDNNLTNFPLINTASGTNFTSAWANNNLTSFPLINTASGTNFTDAWYNNNLTSFPLINTANGTIFSAAWANNNLSSFPLINTANGTNLSYAWYGNNIGAPSYSALLVHMAANNTNTGVTLHAGTSPYYTSAADDRLVLTGTRSWSITDGGKIPDPTGAISGSTTITFGSTGTIKGAGKLSGTTTTTISTTGTVKGVGALSGDTSLTFASTGGAKGTGKLIGTSLISFNSTGTIKGYGSISGTTVLTIDSTGDIKGTGNLSGTTSLTFGSSGDIKGSGKLAGATTITFDSTGALTQPTGSISGSTSITFSSTGTLTGIGKLSGATSLAISANGDLKGLGFLSGTTLITIGTTGNLKGAGTLTGNTVITLGTTGVIKGSGFLSGTTTITFDSTGTLTQPSGSISGATTITFSSTADAKGHGALSGSTLITFLSTGALTQPERVEFEPHIAEGVLMDLQTVFESIYNISEPSAGVSNTTPTDCLSVESSGLYQATVDRTYTVTITTGGVMGVAECNITDSLGTDSILTPQVIINNNEISVGTKGTKIVFNMQGTDEFVAGDTWAITCQYVYYTNVRSVIQVQASPQHLSMLPGIAYTFSDITYDDTGSSNKFRCNMSVQLELWIEERDDQNMQSKLLYALKDIEHAISLDPSRNGYSQDSKIINCTPFLPIPGQPFAAISVELGIWFDNYIT